MFLSRFLFSAFFLAAGKAGAQPHAAVADSLRWSGSIPELAYAVFDADSVLEWAVLGYQRADRGPVADTSDRFHLGSNTKAITAVIAAKLVASGKASWNTRLFDVLPKLRAGSQRAYRNITLGQLLTFRSGLPPYTYSFEQPMPALITGSESGQRYALARWFLRQPPQRPVNGLTPTNAGYVVAGLMLEQLSGHSFQELVAALGAQTGSRFGFDEPNLTDSLQTWGHDADGAPAPPHKYVKMNWLLAAGNINIDLPGYVRFLQKLLPQAPERDPLLPAPMATTLLFGKPVFAFGWFQRPDAYGGRIAWNEGDAGHFLSQVAVRHSDNRVFAVLTNASGPLVREAVTALMNRLQADFPDRASR